MEDLRNKKPRPAGLFATLDEYYEEFWNADRYQDVAMLTEIVDSTRYDRLRHGVFGLTSEAGEIAGILQKVYQGHGNPLVDEDVRTRLFRECGDVLWMVAEILDACDLSMGVCMKINIDKLRERYPDGFEPEKSLNRKDGDI